MKPGKAVLLVLIFMLLTSVLTSCGSAEKGNETIVESSFDSEATTYSRHRCSELYERHISGYNGTGVNIKYDDCNPFGMIAGDFGEITSLSKHTTETASDSKVEAFNSLSESFAAFMKNFEIPTDGTEYIPSIGSDARDDYTSFYDAATELYSYSLVSFTKNISNNLARSAVIGINHPYTMAFGTDVSPERINFQTVIANLFGFDSTTEFMNYAQTLASTYANYRTDVENSVVEKRALENGCFYTTNGSFVFPIAVKNDLSSTVLTYVIIDAGGLVSVWVNDITAALWATNFNEDYHTDSIIENELYCKNVLFVTGLYIDFGTYPQTRVTDSVLINRLNADAGELPTITNAQKWISYDYCVNGNVKNYFWYIDLTYNKEKYRGIYFTEYRPMLTTNQSNENNTYQDDNGYETSTVYWFKYEPIRWRILSEENGDALLLSEWIIDSQAYCTSNNPSTFIHNGEKNFANNYALSDIRKWLNEKFYSVAFTSRQKAIIQSSRVNNQERSTYPHVANFNDSTNDYACVDTEDYIFLLSAQEITMDGKYGFEQYKPSVDVDPARQKEGTDYAKSQGLWGDYNENDEEQHWDSGYWWLRSPYEYNPVVAKMITYSGAPEKNHVVYDTSIGVVPALRIKLFEQIK